MSSTAELVREHQVIERVLTSLDGRLRAAREAGTLDAAWLRTVVTFSRQFIDRCHHGKEEGCLFPCLERRGIPREGGPIGVMLREHQMGRELVRRITEALDGYARGTAPLEEVLVPGQAYVDLLRQHIVKENTILFPMADAVLETGDDDANLRCFGEREEEIGHGAHARLVRLAEEITEAFPAADRMERP